MTQCPICKTSTEHKVANTPYWECPTCLVWFQDPRPPKVYHGPDEPDVDGLSERDTQLNRDLAKSLFEIVMQGKRGRTLDIGCKHPVLAAALGELGCEAIAIDAKPPTVTPGVTTYAYDFEAASVNAGSFWREPFRLITMIHVFEHMADPLETLRKLRSLVTEDGRVFLRIPDHFTNGFERDLTPHHYAIHPYFHCFPSILECLAQTRDLFVVERSDRMENAGQRDIVLRPIVRRPMLAVAMIAKNEERDIGRSIRSLTPFVDKFCLVDTGSTDRTVEVAAEAAGSMEFVAAHYYGASEKDEAGDWKLWDFSKARNFALDLAETSAPSSVAPDWIMWVDADDEFKTPNAIRRAMYWPQYDVFGMWIDGDGQRWIQQRMWKAEKHVRFKGRCHEYAVIDHCAGATIDESLIVHHAQPIPSMEESNPRNLRIMLREWEEGPNARTAFYMGNTHKDARRFKEAAEWYRRRLAFPPVFRDEELFSRLYLARCLRELGEHDEADEICREGLKLAPEWAEFTMDLAFGAYKRGKYDEAIALCTAASERIHQTPLWRETPMYRDQPLRLISWCHEHRGDIFAALKWAAAAARVIGSQDADWNQRTERLRAQWDARDAPAPAVIKKLRPLIALHRPGAIGDILMTLNLVPALKAANPEAEIHYFCEGRLAAPDALGSTILHAGCAMAMDCAGLPAWRKRYDKVIDLVGYPLREGYPDKPMRLHLLEYFAHELGIGDLKEDDGFLYRDGEQVLPALTLPLPPTTRPGRPYVTIQTRAGWSAYKEWPAERWQEVISALYDKGIDLVRIDQSEGRTLSESIGVFANARMHLGIDSFCNHLTNYYWQDESGSARKVRGVVLWGSTQASAAGYPSNTNISKGLSCQPCFRENPAISRMPRDPCKVGSVVYGDGKHRCMAEISVRDVVDAALRLWETA